MLLDVRRDLVKMGESDLIWDISIKLWAQGMRSERIFTMLGQTASLGQNLISKKLAGPLSGWTDYRSPPIFAQKSFHQLWKERRGKSNEQP
jgi:hypothetical protein